MIDERPADRERPEDLGARSAAAPEPSGHAAPTTSEPRLPQGTVTFLLTDIEDSTSLWERNSQGMEAALARHDAILRSGIERLGGIIFKTTGDGAYAVFPRAADALTAALETQRELSSAQWSETGPLKVRMALLTDVAQQRDG